MLFKEIIAVYCENHAEPTTNTLGKMLSYLLLKQVVHIVTSGL
jgi:hypothetical protein